MLLLCVNLPQTTSYWILPPPQKLPVSKQKNTFKKNGGPRHPGSLQWLGGPFRLVYRNVDLESDTFLGRIYLALGGVKPRPPRSLIVNRDFSLLRFGDPDLNPWKLTWHWEITMFNRKYIFKQLVLHCHVSFRGSKPSFDTTGKDNPKFFFAIQKRYTCVGDWILTSFSGFLQFRHVVDASESKRRNNASKYVKPICWII